MRRQLREKGQASVEYLVVGLAFITLMGALAAIWRFIASGGLSSLMQAAVLLYDRCIMTAAATEGCRLVATSTVDDATTHTYVERRLEAIPRIGIFHVGGDWAINWSRSQEGTANVIIENHVQPLPFFGILAGLASETGDDGTIMQRADVYCSPIPDWVGKQGYSPSSWIGAWQ